jgi:GNAT superfamily N-acetyltransferase
MESKDAVIALDNGNLCWFCYIESWQSNYVAHSGLIVHPDYRNLGLAKKIKSKVFDYSLKKYPNAKYLEYNWFSCNENQLRIGYKPVPFQN